MDAARSALRCGAASGDRRLPARSRRHAGSVRGGRGRRARRHRSRSAADRRQSRCSVTVASRASASRPRRPPASSRAIARHMRRSPEASQELAVQTILVAVGEEPDPSILPEGAGIEMSAWAGIAADRRTLATGRAGVFAGGDVRQRTEDDHRRRGRRSTRSRPPSTSTWPASAMASARSSPRSATATPLETSADPRSGAARPGPSHRSPSTRAGPSSRRSSASTTRWQAPRRARCFRCDADLSLQRCPCRGRTGPARGRCHATARRWRPNPCRSSAARRAVMTPEQVSGFFDAGESFVEGTIGAALVLLWLVVIALQLGRPYILRQPAQVHAAPGRRPVVDHLHRHPQPAAHQPLPGQLHLLLPGRGRRARTCP